MTTSVHTYSIAGKAVLTPVHTHSRLSSPLSFSKRMLRLCNYYNGYACVWAAYCSRWGQNMLLALPDRVPHKWGSALSKASCTQSHLGLGERRWGWSDELGSVLGTNKQKDKQRVEGKQKGTEGREQMAWVIAQAVSRRFPTAVDWVLYHIRLCRICGGQRGSG
jgi:hypothetical protein